MADLPPLGAVRVFDAVARHGNFTKAAAELNMTQSAVSYQIKLLEEFAGGPLFVREARGVSLTAVGRELAPAIGQSLQGLARAFRVTRADSANVLSISTFQTVANAWLAPRIGSFQIAHPELAVRIDLSSELVDLDGGGFDVAIRSGKGVWPGVTAHFLFDQSFTAVASPLYLDRAGPPATPQDLLAHRLIAPSDPWWPIWFEAAGVKDAAISQRQGIDVETQHTAALVAASGHGVALVTPSLHKEALQSGRLVQLFDVMATSGNNYYLAYAPRTARTRKLKLFRDWALKEAGG